MISLTLCWQASDHTDIFVNQRIECYINSTIYSVCSPLNSIHYAMLYPQNGNCIVAIDFVTSRHPMYTLMEYGSAGGRLAHVEAVAAKSVCLYIF